MTDTVLDFYNQLANDYHLAFADWRESIRREGALLDKLIRAEMGEGPLAVLDCSCGIGTQAIGLAGRGHRVHATDLSPGPVERAKKEAPSFGVSLTFGLADLRALARQVEGSFDVVISCDNAITHLLDDEDLALAARNMRAKVRPGGLLLLGLRDYDRVLAEKSQSTRPRIFDDARGKRIVFQSWDWGADGQPHTIHLFIVRQIDGVWQTLHQATPMRALRRKEVSRGLAAAGFRQMRWQMPPETGYYQPLLTARRE